MPSIVLAECLYACSGSSSSGRASTIVLAECLYLLEKKGRGSLFLDLLNAVEAHPAYDIYPLTAAVLREMPNIVGLAELHDRIIVATAKVNNAVLITKDEEIRRSGYIPTTW